MAAKIVWDEVEVEEVVETKQADLVPQPIDNDELSKMAQYMKMKLAGSLPAKRPTSVEDMLRERIRELEAEVFRLQSLVVMVPMTTYTSPLSPYTTVTTADPMYPASWGGVQKAFDWSAEFPTGIGGSKESK